MSERLHLLIPGLCGPWSEVSDLAIPQPAVKRLNRLLSQAEVEEQVTSGFEATLCRLFGLSVDKDTDLPIAALTHLADCGQAEGWWLRADPVQLRADMRRVVLNDASELAISESETHSLRDAFNQTFADDQLVLETPTSSRWYLQLVADPEITTTSLTDAIGRDIKPLLPRGHNSTRWRTRLTEIQMLFYGLALNAEREAAHRPPISGLWLWGGGYLPTEVTAPAPLIFANDPLSHGLAQRANCVIKPLPETASAWWESSDGADSLVVLATPHGTLDRFNEWSEAVAILEQHWFAPLYDWLKQARLSELVIHSCSRRYRIDRRQLRRFWRRTRPMSELLG